jgi:hypothetical protein
MRPGSLGREISMSRKSNVGIGGLVFAIAAIAACATAVRGGSPDVGTTPIGATTSELIGGDTGSPFDTGAIEIWIANATQPACTAVMLGPNQILTAAHCVVVLTMSDGGAPGPGEKTSVITTAIKSDYLPLKKIAFANGSVVTAASTFFETTVVGTDLPPDFLTGCSAGCRNDFSVQSPYPPDLAIITVADTFPQTFGLTSRVTSAAFLDPVTEVGYGCTKSLNTWTAAPPTFKSSFALVLDPMGGGPHRR